MNRRDRARESRRRLLVGAAELFDVHGFNGVVIGDLIDHSGIPETSIYFQFPTMDAVGVALVQLQGEQWQQLIDEASERHQQGKVSALEVVVAVSFAVARRLRDDVVSRAGVRLVQEGGPTDRVLPDPFAAWKAQTTALLGAAREEGAVSPNVDPVAAARVLVDACYGVGHLAATRHPGTAGAPVDVEQRLTTLWELLLGGLCPASTNIGEVVAHAHLLADEL
jgi:AcrR family transcriptional regulator